MSWRHAGARALVAFGTLVFVLIFNFFLFRAVGDPKKDLIRSRLSPAAREAVIRERGLDKDKLTQFRIYIEQTLQGDLGTSNNSRKAGPRRADRRAAEHAAAGRHRHGAVLVPRLLDGGDRRGQARAVPRTRCSRRAASCCGRCRSSSSASSRSGCSP